MRELGQLGPGDEDGAGPDVLGILDDSEDKSCDDCIVLGRVVERTRYGTGTYLQNHPHHREETIAIRAQTKPR